MTVAVRTSDALAGVHAAYSTTGLGFLQPNKHRTVVLAMSNHHRASVTVAVRTSDALAGGHAAYPTAGLGFLQPNERRSVVLAYSDNHKTTPRSRDRRGVHLRCTCMRLSIGYG